VPTVVLLVFGFLWMFVLRVAVYVALAASGLAPSVG
jgi:hypothetical protein